MYTVTALPNPVETLFRGARFCSRKCLRAFCLELLETVDAIDTPQSEEMVTDLHELTIELAETLVAVL